MNIDLLPFSAFALESSGALSPAALDGRTLTLPLELVPIHAAFGPAMSGTLSVDPATPDTTQAFHVAVVPARSGALTITFQAS